ncbi:MAG: transglutaminase-like domain-containing protein [Abditibacteriales bacterium]|nr:transglutaminase-like domain-containing protein [Abditibacteriales bacterium]MDW8366495.1 transglutaminase-like domain-containing protein [Abditibacteriales bacterium]
MRQVGKSTFFWAVALSVVAVRVSKAAEFPQEMWMGVYALGNKIGYIHVIVEQGKFGNGATFRIKSEARMKMALMGEVTDVMESSTQWVDKEWRPTYLETNWKSGERPMRVVARFAPKAIYARMFDGVKTTEKTIPLKPTDDLRVDADVPLPGQPLPIGHKRTFKTFNHTTLSLDTVETEVLRREEIEFEGQRVNTTAIKTTLRFAAPAAAHPAAALGGGVSMMLWVNDAGEPLKMQMAFVTMLKEPREKAMSEPSQVYDPQRDLIRALSVKAPAPFKDPRKVKRLVVRFSGIESKDLILSDERQRATVEQDSNGWQATYTITADEAFGDENLTLPLKPPAEVAVFLKPSALIPTQDENIKATVNTILNGEKNAARAAQKIRDWVFAKMKPRGNIGIPRSAVEVLKNKDGVCRDYAILYTALARAAGIPTRLCVGVMYAGDGFYYHAWAESWLGKWVAVDATLPFTLVDATHVKFGHGDTESFFATASIVGQLKAEILEGQ